MTQALTLPTIHLNGTSAARLRDAYSAAWTAVEAALDAIRETAPNARDYYPDGPEAIQAANRDHRARQQRLADIQDELVALIQHCDR